jgi:hypothetical protein
MAEIDKIYVTRRQFRLLEEWYWWMVVEDKLDPKFIPWNQYNLALAIWKDEDTDKHPVWNLPTSGDVWLLCHCPFEFVKEQIEYKYVNGFFD